MEPTNWLERQITEEDEEEEYIEKEIIIYYQHFQ